jgi:hypothetical protein
MNKADPKMKPHLIGPKPSPLVAGSCSLILVLGRFGSKSGLASYSLPEHSHFSCSVIRPYLPG